MVKEKQIMGEIVSGRGEAKGFMEISWVREQCFEKAGFEPFSGTLNLKVSPEDFNFFRRISSSRGERLIPPPEEGDFCEARLLKVRANGVVSALLFPMVDNYYSDILEIVAPVGLKRHLRLSDNDQLQLSVILPQKMPAPEGIIFDLDGTLLNSIELYYSILSEGCQALGVAVPPREKVMDIMGRGIGFWDAWEELIMAMDPELEIGELRKKFIHILEDVWRSRYDQEVTFFPGVIQLLARLQESGMLMGVVTSSFYSKKMNIFRENNLEPGLLFRSVITRRDTTKSKPDPEPLLRCLELLNTSPQRSLCVGDSPCDITAGREAGMITVGVLTGTGTRQSLSKEGVDFILDNISELPEIFDLEGELF
ncbi:MAG: HAD-IA family hydrolase [Bacillota bacterium]|nr:HAD-IA family hydrolase [Bacillota bacterium]